MTSPILCYPRAMRMLRAGGVAITLLALQGSPAASQYYDFGGNLRPIDLARCEKLRASLGKAVPIDGTFSAGIERFREGAPGLKGRQCRIAAEGPARDRPGAIAPDLDGLAASVRTVLEEAGWRESERLDRYAKRGQDARAFALRQGRATCWANLAREEGDRAQEAVTRQGQATFPVFFRLTVDCFEG